MKKASATIDGDRPSDEVHDCIRATLARDDGEEKVREFDAVFASLKADVLEGLAQADRGEGVTAEEMRRMFGLREKS